MLSAQTLSGNETSRISPSVYTNCFPNSYQFWLHRSTSLWIVLKRSAFSPVISASLYIVSIRVHSYWFLSHRCAFLSIRCDSHWFVLVRSTHSYCIVVHRVYTVLILIGLYVIVAHLISWERDQGNVLFNDALNTFYLRLYGVGHMIKDHSDSERGNPLPPHGLLFPINSNGSFYMHHHTDRIAHTTAFVTPVVDHWLEREGSIRRPIAPWANALTTELHLAPNW